MRSDAYTHTRLDSAPSAVGIVPLTPQWCTIKDLPIVTVNSAVHAFEVHTPIGDGATQGKAGKVVRDRSSYVSVARLPIVVGITPDRDGSLDMSSALSVVHRMTQLVSHENKAVQLPCAREQLPELRQESNGGWNAARHWISSQGQ